MIFIIRLFLILFVLDVIILNPNYLETQKWIIREDGSGTKEYMDLFLASHEITPKQIMTMGSNYAIIKSVRYHLGVTILSLIVAKLPAKQKNLYLSSGRRFSQTFFLCSAKDYSPFSCNGMLYQCTQKLYYSSLFIDEQYFY